MAGFQSYWYAGVEWHVQRDPIDGVIQPWMNLGTIDESTPNFSVEQISKENFASGKGRLVAQNITGITEKYSVTVGNLTLQNWALSLLANPPQAFAQTQASKIVKHYAHPGRLFKLRDSDADATPLYRILTVPGIIKGTSNPPYATKSLVSSGTAINASGKVITISGNHAAVATLGAGKRIIVATTGLANVANAFTYTVASIANNGGNTDITVVEPPFTDESSVTGGVVYHASDTSNDLVLALTGFDVPSVSRGIARVIADGVDFATAQYVYVVFTTEAFSGNRLIVPQNASGEIKCNYKLVYGRGGNAQRTVRDGRCSIAPSGQGLAPKSYASLQFEVSILSDTTLAQPAGRLLSSKGTLPDFS